MLAVSWVAAGKVAFASNSTLLLTQLANTSQYLTFPPDPRFGVLSQVLCVATACFAIASRWGCLQVFMTVMMAPTPDMRATGCTAQAQLASPAFGANGSWAGSPQAVLAGSYNGQLKTILLELDTCAPCLIVTSLLLWPQSCSPQSLS